MKTERKESTILRITARPERGDRCYGRIRNLAVDVDVDEWKLVAQADGTVYSHVWPKEDFRSFLEFLSSVEKAYLLSKVSVKTEFDRDATDAVLVDLKSEDEDKEEAKRILSEVEERHDPIRFAMDLETADRKKFLTSGWWYDAIQKRYAPEVLDFADLFMTAVVPEIRKAAAERKNRLPKERTGVNPGKPLEKGRFETGGLVTISVPLPDGVLEPTKGYGKGDVGVVTAVEENGAGEPSYEVRTSSYDRGFYYGADQLEPAPEEAVRKKLAEILARQ